MKSCFHNLPDRTDCGVVLMRYSRRRRIAIKIAIKLCALLVGLVIGLLSHKLIGVTR